MRLPPYRQIHRGPGLRLDHQDAYNAAPSRRGLSPNPFRIRRQGIPNPGKPKSLEILDVHGGEIRDALAEKAERQAPVEGTPPGEVLHAETWPE